MSVCMSGVCDSVHRGRGGEGVRVWQTPLWTDIFIVLKLIILLNVLHDTVADPVQGPGRGPRNMKSMRLASAAIFL